MTASVANQEIPKSNGITDGIDGYHRRVLITGLRSSIIPLELWDLPGNEDVLDEDLQQYLQLVHAVVFVIDINDHWFNPIAQFSDMLAAATEAKALHLVFHIFVHKMETLANENKNAKFNDIQRRINDEIDEQNLQSSPLVRSIAFHATSIYDHSIYEAFSSVVTRLIPQETLGQYENLLNSVHLSCGSKYAFLFDLKACLRLSANQETHEMPTFSLSVEYLKLLTSMSGAIGTGLREGTTDDAYSCQLVLSETIVAFWQINKELCLIMGLSSANWRAQRATIEYNVLMYRETLLRVLEVIEKHRKSNAAAIKGPTTARPVS
ncbi:hypothetical protein FRC19_008466 [Serendipita sp. 401]|nr:hypothetical protein FRC19_008466 [Serendipita sp. 401]